MVETALTGRVFKWAADQLIHVCEVRQADARIGVTEFGHSQVDEPANMERQPQGGGRGVEATYVNDIEPFGCGNRLRATASPKSIWGVNALCEQVDSR